MAESALRNLFPSARDRILSQQGQMPSAPAQQSMSMVDRARRFTALDTPQDMSLGETLADIGMGFAPGIGTAQGVRDFERARRDDDLLGMALGGISVLPLAGALVKAGRAAGEVVGGFGDVVQTARAGERIELPVMDTINPKGYSESPLMAQVDPNVRPETISSGTFNRRVQEYQNDPVIKRREDARLLGGLITTPEDLFIQSANYEQFLGRPIITLPADRSNRALVSRVAGVDIDPYLVEGGPRHLDRWGNWMSMEDAARTKQLHVNKVADQTGQEPVLMYMSMGHPGSNFSESASAVALRYIDSVGGLTEDGARLLNNKMKAMLDKGDTQGIAKDWPGYESPQQLMSYLATDTPKGPTAGNKRKAFISALDSVEMQNQGAPIMSDVYSAINDPNLRDQPVGFSGYRAMLSRYTDPRDLERNTSMNASYNTVIPARQGLAITDEMVPWNVMFRDPAQARATKQSPYRSLQTAGSAQDYQMANEQWLQGIRDYLKTLRGE